MFIASQKKKENIAEYVLYMWQIEDIIRIYKCDIDAIEANIIEKFQLDNEKKKTLTEWYESLIDMMRTENIQEKGHLQLNKNTVSDITDLHKALIYSQRYPEYTAAFYKALPFISELNVKQNNTASGDIETCLTFLYGILMLKLQQKPISDETSKAMKYITTLLNELSKKYKLYKDDKLDLE